MSIEVRRRVADKIESLLLFYYTILDLETSDNMAQSNEEVIEWVTKWLSNDNRIVTFSSITNHTDDSDYGKDTTIILRLTDVSKDGNSE